MNYFGITTSFVIGGLLIISILALNERINQNTNETVLNMTAKKTVRNVSQIMQRDFQRIGYNMSSSVTDTIKAFTNDKMIEFWADTDTLPSTSAKKITWLFTDKQVKTTKNPNDFKLIRVTSTSPDTLQFAITNFRLEGFDKNNNPTTTASQIKSIFVSLQAQSPEPYDGNQYSTSIWEKTFLPPNLKLQNMDW